MAETMINNIQDIISELFKAQTFYWAQKGRVRDRWGKIKSS